MLHRHESAALLTKSKQECRTPRSTASLPGYGSEKSDGFGWAARCDRGR